MVLSVHACTRSNLVSSGSILVAVVVAVVVVVVLV